MQKDTQHVTCKININIAFQGEGANSRHTNYLGCGMARMIGLKNKEIVAKLGKVSMIHAVPEYRTELFGSFFCYIEYWIDNKWTKIKVFVEK